MKTIKAFIKSHPLLSYFALVFAITWGGFVLAVGPGAMSVAYLLATVLASAAATWVVVAVLAVATASQ
jgi:hypothetical protein